VAPNAYKHGIGSSLSSLSSNTLSSVNASQPNALRVTKFVSNKDGRPLKSNRESRDNQNNIRVDNGLEGWCQTMPVEAPDGTD